MPLIKKTRNEQILQANDYFPFGMTIPDRTYTHNSVKYKYGFNGQMKDDDIFEGAYTAMYWEYDSRLGRRWNVDPVIKVWLSPYSCLRNNPIVWIDPNGDDDIFDRSGKFLFSTAEGNKIRVINDKIKLEDAQSNPIANTKLITEFSYFPKDKSNREMLASIATHYALAVGVKKNVNVRDSEKNTTALASYLAKSGKYNIIVYKGKINSQAGDAFNLMNSFVHEKVHEVNPETNISLNHTSAILTQINDKTFDNTTEDFKRAAGKYAADLLTKALTDGEASLEDINSKIVQFNNSKLGKFSTLEYNEKTKSVNSNVTLKVISIKSISKKNQVQQDSIIK